MDLFEGVQLLFIALKLIGIIDWSWIWVLSPIWILFLLVAFTGYGGNNK